MKANAGSMNKSRPTRERSVMIRPLLVLAAFFVLTLGVATGSFAAEPFAPVMAQIQNMTRGPGLYLNLLKFVPVVFIYLLWVKTTDWVEHDTNELNNLKFGIWHSIMFFPACSGSCSRWRCRFTFWGWGSWSWRIQRRYLHMYLCVIRRSPTTKKC